MVQKWASALPSYASGTLYWFSLFRLSVCPPHYGCWWKLRICSSDLREIDTANSSAWSFFWTVWSIIAYLIRQLWLDHDRLMHGFHGKLWNCILVRSSWSWYKFIQHTQWNEIWFLFSGHSGSVNVCWLYTAVTWLTGDFFWTVTLKPFIESAWNLRTSTRPQSTLHRIN